MFHHNEVKPSTSSSATCSSSVLPADFLKVDTDILGHCKRQESMPRNNTQSSYIELLSGERATSDTSSIRLDDTNGLPDQLGWDSKTGADTTNGR